ncbi:hypothetical protein [Streptomyces sp. NPDC126503]
MSRMRVTQATAVLVLALVAPLFAASTAAATSAPVATTAQGNMGWQ